MQSTEAEGARKPRTIVSGIQPTGIPHVGAARRWCGWTCMLILSPHRQLGNYLGALQNWVRLQEEAATTQDKLVFFIAGLHAITIPQDPKRLWKEKRDMMATLLAVGLDPHRCTMFHQDQVQEHSELAWYFNCITPVGKLNRMTTWKVRRLAWARRQHLH